MLMLLFVCLLCFRFFCLFDCGVDGSLAYLFCVLFVCSGFSLFVCLIQGSFACLIPVIFACLLACFVVC